MGNDAHRTLSEQLPLHRVATTSARVCNPDALEQQMPCSYQLPSEYQAFIHKTRYARYLWDAHRRETWQETVQRYFDFMQQHLEKQCGYTLQPGLRARLENAVLHLDVMPSMRALMTAGPALERCNIAGYNCSYLPVDSPRAFSEALFILMTGCGVGYSVECRYVDQLPPVPLTLAPSTHTVVVQDSAEGWAAALLDVLEQLWKGIRPTWDVSGVRPAGTPLRTMGGRASGPGPLVALFERLVAQFEEAAGRQLTPLECHDLMCLVGEVVVVGGVRRSALICLSDLHDQAMRTCKSGAWWEAAPFRALANVSAVYDQRPSRKEFDEEWAALRASGSGERGIFSRSACMDKVQSLPHRSGANNDGSTIAFGTNPCSEIILRPFQFCNLTEVVVRAGDGPAELLRKIEDATVLGTFQATLTKFPVLRPEWTHNTVQERLLGVSLTGIMDNAVTNAKQGVSEIQLVQLLQQLRRRAREVNAEVAGQLGIEQSAAITCIKPSGTVSQLVNSASGIHPRYSSHYIRTVRGDAKDPLTQFLQAHVPSEPCVMKPESTVVFAFPIACPEGAVTRDEVSALDQLKLWLLYNRHYCDHKPSITVYVREHEWDEVGDFVYSHFDEISGVAFLPFDNGTYKQAPYQPITREEYEALQEQLPAYIPWELFEERVDGTVLNKQFACSADSCEVVDVS